MDKTRFENKVKATCQNVNGGGGDTPTICVKQTTRHKFNLTPIVSSCLQLLVWVFMLTILSFSMLGRTHAKFVSRVNFNGEDQLAGFNITCGGYKDTETSLTTTIAPGESKGLVAKISYFSQVPTEFLNVSTTYLNATGVLSDFKALLAAYEDYKQIHNPNGKAPTKLSECFMVSLTETSFAKVIAKELYTNHGLEKLASTAVGPMPETATTALNLEIPMNITWLEHNDPDWDTWDTFLGEQFAQSDVETTISLKLNIRAQQVIGDVTLPSVPIIVDGKEVGSFHLSDDLNLNDSITQANLGITTDNSIGWYLDEALTEPAPDDYIPTEGTTVYTKMATLDKLTISSNGTIRCKDKNIEGEVVLPKTVNGKQVTTIPSSAFSDCKNITSVIIPAGIQTIDQGVFRGCENLVDVNLPKGLTTILYGAFSNCNKLNTIEIPSTVTQIGGDVFYNNTNLEYITIPSGIESIGYDAFQKCNSLQYTQYDNAYYLGNEDNPYLVLVKAINTNIYSCDIHEDTRILYGARNATSGNNGSFRSCTQLKTIILPSKLIQIGEYAFERCYALKCDIILPDTLTEIGQCAFRYCNKITGIHLGNNLKRIEASCFDAGSDNIKYIHIGDQVNKFYLPNSKKSLKSISLSPQNKNFYIESNCLLKRDTNELILACNTEESINVLKNNAITKIAVGAFYGCSELKGQIIISNSVTSIGSYAFYGCSGLTGNLVIPSGETSIGSYTFYGCRGLTGDLIIPSGVTSIGSSAFYGCSGFTGDLIIPSGVTSIGSSAFEGCSGLTGDLVIPNNVTSIGNYAFYNCSGFTGDLIIPSGVTSIIGSAFGGCGGLTSIAVEAGNTKYHSAGNCLIETASKTLLLGCKNSVIPQDGSVTIIGVAFQNCSGLTSVVIPSGVTSIGNYAFYGCSGLTSVAIPNSVTSIGSSAFYGCSGFTGDLIIPSGVTSIGSSAFYGCSGLTKVVIDSNATATNNTYLQNLNIRSGTYYKVTHVYINKTTVTGTLGTTLTSYFTKQEDVSALDPATDPNVDLDLINSGYDLWIKNS